MNSTPMSRRDHPGEDTPRRDVTAPLGDVLDEVLGRFSAIEAAPETRALVAQVLAATLMAFTRTRSVRDPLPDTAPESAEEALAVLAGVGQLRASLAAIDASWQVAAEDRIRRNDLARGVPSSQQGRGAGQEIGLARRVSPSASSFSLAKARRLVQYMPGAIDRLWAGAMTDRQASAVSGALDGASADTCHRVDDHLLEHPEFLQGKGFKRLRSDTQKLVQQLEPETSRARAERAARARHVTMRPLADGMARVTAVLRGIDAAGLMNSLNCRAQSLRAAGAKASVPALEADLLVDDVLRGSQVQETDDQHIEPNEPVSEPVDPGDEPGAFDDAEDAETADEIGEAREAREADAVDAVDAVDADPDADADADAAAAAAAAEKAPPRMPRTRPGLDVGIVISDTALLGPDDGSETAELEGYGTIPAHIVRDTLLGQPPGHLQADEGEHPDDVVSAFYRRLYRSPRTGELIAMESRARAFPAGLARMIRWRDTTCRTPWCDAKIRHIDHVVPHSKGGPTSYANGQGLCVRCNLLKELGLWVLSPLRRSHAVAGKADAGMATGTAMKAAAEADAEAEAEAEADGSKTTLADPSAPPRAWIWSSPHGAVGISFTPSQFTPPYDPPPEEPGDDDPEHGSAAPDPDPGDESEPPGASPAS